MQNLVVAVIISWLVVGCSGGGSSSGGGTPNVYFTIERVGETPTNKARFDYVDFRIREATRYFLESDAPDIRRVVLVDNGRSNINLNRYQININQPLENSSPMRIASDFVHEQCHIEGGLQCSTAEENRCTRVQIEFLKERFGSAAQRDIDFLESQIGVHSCS